MIASRVPCPVLCWPVGEQDRLSECSGSTGFDPGGVASVKRQRVPVVARVVMAAAAVVLLSGCGGALYAVQASSATSKLEEAKEVGAEKYAPYEYYFAREHLTKASEEASHANYGDAVDLAEAAEEAADKAIKLSKEAHRGAGR